MYRYVIVVVVVLVAGCSAKRSPDLGYEFQKEMVREAVTVVTGTHPSFQVFDELLNATVDHTISGNGHIPCDRHDGSLFLIEGGEFKDTVKCSWGREIVCTKGDDDKIDVGWGNDVVIAGTGNDTIEGSWGDEIIYGGPGNDVIDESWGRVILLYGKNWGNDIVDVHCDAPAVLVFSKDIKEKDLVWNEGKVLYDTAHGSTIQFDGSINCLKMIFSDIDIP